MKKFLSAGIVAIVIMLTLASCSGSYTVTSQPSAPYYSRPVSPGAGYIWVDGDWRWRNGSYRWREGYWSQPRYNRTWRPGYWQPRGKGYYWRRGRWH